MTETKLLPCPLCGCDTPRDDVYIRDGREVQCPSCGCSVHAFNPDANKEAVAKWNARTPDPRIAAAQGLADALKALVALDDGDQRFAWDHEIEFNDSRDALAAWETFIGVASLQTET